MVDYVPVLARAIATLEPNTSDSRRALYDRARKVLVDKLRANDPTLSATDLRMESVALETAIRRVEEHALRRATQPKPQQVAYEASVEEYPDRPPLKDRRRSPLIVAGAIGTLVILLIGVAAYSFWPHIVSKARSIAGQRNISEAVEQPSASTGYVYLRQAVYYRTTHPVGTIIVDKLQGFLYVVRPSLSALRYSIGVGPECITLAGLYQIVRKEEWPGWQPPSQLSANPGYDQMKNPLGARALYFTKDFRIHGTNAPATVRQRGAQGCVRLVNDDVVYLFDRTSLDHRVVVLN